MYEDSYLKPTQLFNLRIFISHCIMDLFSSEPVSTCPRLLASEKKQVQQATMFVANGILDFEGSNKFGQSVSVFIVDVVWD